MTDKTVVNVKTKEVMDVEHKGGLNKTELSGTKELSEENYAVEWEAFDEHA